jgi:methyl-accepting chemotaxis protein
MIMQHLTEKYRINTRNLALRKKFIDLSPEKIATLSKLQNWADQIADRLAKEFYNVQFDFEPTRTFFEQYATEHDIPVAKLRSRLEKTQIDYFREIFQEAAHPDSFGPDYFEKRLKVGRLHNVINLPLKWYVGSYTIYQRLVRKHLKKSFWYRPGFRARAEVAIFTVFNFDMQAVSDAFFYDYLESIGLNLQEVEIQSADHDLSEYYEIYKSAVRNTLEHTARTSALLVEASEQMASAASQSEMAVGQIAQTIQQVAYGTGEQVQSITTTAHAFDEMSQAISGVAQGAQEQAMAVNRSSEITNQMSDTIQQVALNAQDSAREAAEASEIARHSAETVERTIQGLHQIKDSVNQSARKVKEMGDRSKQIGMIVETIDGIANQTNLLALNAAIEAARAGEHGKGFAVVADEVRKLAEKSAAATREIAQLIDSIQLTVSEATETMEAGVKRVEADVAQSDQAAQALTNILKAIESIKIQVVGISDAAQHINQSSSDLVHNMESVSAVVEENTASTQEMAASSIEVTESINSIASVSQENGAAVEQVSAATEEMTAQVTEVSDYAKTLNDMAQNLQSLLTYFNLSEATDNSLSDNTSAQIIETPMPTGNNHFYN